MVPAANVVPRPSNLFGRRGRGVPARHAHRLADAGRERARPAGRDRAGARRRLGRRHRRRADRQALRRARHRHRVDRRQARARAALGADDVINTDAEDLVEGQAPHRQARRRHRRRARRHGALRQGDPRLRPGRAHRHLRRDHRPRCRPSTCATSSCASSTSWARPWAPRAILFEILDISRRGGSGRSSTGCFLSSQVRAAHRLLEDRKQFGKIVLVPRLGLDGQP